MDLFGEHPGSIGRRAALALGLTAGLLLSVPGCGKNDDVVTTVPIPTISVSSPAWSGVGDDQVVATVDDIAIAAWRVSRVLKAAPPGTTVEQALDMVIDEELIARKAAGDTGLVPDRKVYEKTLAAQWVEKHLITEFQPDDVPMSMLQEAFSMPQVWAKFNHYDMYEIQDYQWICCPDPRNCDASAAEPCFKEGGVLMKNVYESIVRESPSPLDMEILALEYRKLAYHLTYQEYQFAFDKTAGYQKGVTHVDQTLAAELMKAEPGTFLPPVKSEYGWHVPYLKTHHPEAHGDLNDPAVRHEIAEVFIQRFRQQYFLETLAGLVPIDSLKLLSNYYEGRTRPSGKPVYDVVVDRDALRRATAVEASEHQKEVPNL